ncbi:MAG: 2-oxoacid:acceptor oxidoreductase subunit alpha [Coriobacteriia bacterium]|nr:2-oxoacid:acceptor oxidoreductase subunit alpha [Coriobacteriia bacterium]
MLPDPRGDDRPDIQIKIGGQAGFGIKAAGQSLARCFVAGGLHTFDLTEYPSLIRGGHNVYQVRVSPEPVHCQVTAVDILVALNQESVDTHVGELVDGGALVYDPAKVSIDGVDRAKVCAVAVPFDEIVAAAGGAPIMRNVAALGAVLGLSGYPLSYLTDSLRAQFARKAPEIAEQNVAVATAGYESGTRAECVFPFRLSPLADPPRRLLVDGNEAIGLGALAAGIGMYCAYPMTPASSLLSFMAAHDREYGVVVKHTEDEIAAMNMVVGAAFGGARAMCATAGGGFALMVEAFGLAGVSESAVVVGVFTRPGPATGLPTWTEQSDLRYVLHAAQGEFPRVILAPGDTSQAFELTWRAFNLADQLQTPVIVLGDTYLQDNRRSTEPFDLAAVTVDRGKLLTEGDTQGHPEALSDDGIYLRYKVTEDGVSLRALPGVKGACQVVNSYEHDEYGYGAQGETAANRIAQNEKRMRKLDLARATVPPPIRFGSSPKDADVSVICFGTTVQPVREAVGWLARDGVKVAALQVVTLWPFPTEDVATFLGTSKRTVVIEGNFTGQLEGLMRQECLLGVDEHLHRYDGRPFAPEQVYATLKEVADRA